MTDKTHIIGIGQRIAGDDGVGLAIVRALRDTILPEGVLVHELQEPLRLFDFLNGDDAAIIIVDAVIDNGPPGQIKCLTVDELEEENLSTLSSHGASVMQVIELADNLSSTNIRSRIRLLGVTIDRPTRYTSAISPRVRAAIPDAIQRIVEMIEE